MDDIIEQTKIQTNLSKSNNDFAKVYLIEEINHAHHWERIRVFGEITQIDYKTQIIIITNDLASIKVDIKSLSYDILELNTYISIIGFVQIQQNEIIIKGTQACRMKPTNWILYRKTIQIMRKTINS